MVKIPCIGVLQKRSHVFLILEDALAKSHSNFNEFMALL